MITVQLRAHHTMPAQARTDSAKPIDLLRNGSTSSKIMLATARLRTPAVRLPDPSAAKATRPIAAARSTLGSVRHKATKMTTPASPTMRSHHPRTPTQRATVSRNASSSVRFAPDTAVRWVKAGRSKSSVSSASSPEVSPRTRAGTSARGSGRRSATARRNPSRTRSTSRRPWRRRAPRRLVSRGPATRLPRPSLDPVLQATLHRDSAADRDLNHFSSAGPLTTTSTGARTSQVPPRPSTRTVAAS